MLAEFFVKNEIAGELFNLARIFEAKVYSTTFLRPAQLDLSCQAILGLIADFYHIDRRALLA